MAAKPATQKAETQEATKEAPKTNERIALPPGRLKFMENAHNRFAAHAPAETTPEMLQSGMFWSVHAGKLRPYDRIDVIPDDGQWMAECLVLGVGNNYAKVQVLNLYELNPVVVDPKSSNFTIDWRGPELKWSVIRKDDSKVVREGLDTQELAAQWMREHERTVGR